MGRRSNKKMQEDGCLHLKIFHLGIFCIGEWGITA